MKRYIWLSAVVVILSLAAFTAVMAEAGGGEAATEKTTEYAGGHSEAKNATDGGWPKAFGRLGAAIAFGLGAFGTAMVQAKVGSAGVGSIAEKPETVGSVIILMALPETIVILGFVVGAMLILM